MQRWVLTRYDRAMKSRVEPAFPVASLATLLLATTQPAQTTLNVGPGAYAEIADAVAAAQPGDLIVVQPGTYLPFNVSIGLRIVAPSGANVTTPPGIGGLIDVQPPAGQQATIVGLSFYNNTAYPPAEPPVTVRVLGNAVFTDCSFRVTSDYPGHAVVCDGDAQFDRCHMFGFRDCMAVTGGRVVANSCVFSTARVDWADPAPTCITVSNAEVRLNFCDLHGADINPLGAHALRLSAGAKCSIADSSVTGGDSTHTGLASTAVDNDSVHPVLHTRSTITGSYGVTSVVPFLVGNGPGFDGPAQETTLIGGVADPAGPRVGASYHGWVIAPTAGIAITVLSFTRTAAIQIPIAADPVHFDPAAATIHSVGLPAPGSPWPGVGLYSWQTVRLPPSLLGEQFWLHAAFWDGSSFLVGPTFGGLVR